MNSNTAASEALPSISYNNRPEIVIRYNYFEMENTSYCFAQIDIFKPNLYEDEDEEYSDEEGEIELITDEERPNGYSMMMDDYNMIDMSVNNKH